MKRKKSCFFKGCDFSGRPETLTIKEILKILSHFSEILSISWRVCENGRQQAARLPRMPQTCFIGMIIFIDFPKVYRIKVNIS